MPFGFLFTLLVGRTLARGDLVKGAPLGLHPDVESTVPVICQIGRADVRQANLAYYTVMGFPA